MNNDTTQNPSYVCATCRKTKIGRPALSNGAGDFCLKCRERMMNNQRASSALRAKERHAKLASGTATCMYCGDVLDNSNTFKSTELSFICAPCQRKRDWALKCIRHSSKMYNYIVKCEEREAPQREARELVMKNTKQTVFESSPTEDSRIDKLEQMMQKLLSELGG